VVHPGNPSIGTCERCGNFLCGVCRTRWYDRVLCTACVERALDTQEARPEEARAHLRRAILALVFGLVAWLFSVLAGLLTAAAAKGDDMNMGLLGLAVMIFLAGLVPALIGVGQGAAAIRERGDHMILATLGLILSGMNAGVVIGLITMNMFISS
jgi:hypothetical protein